MQSTEKHRNAKQSNAKEMQSKDKQRNTKQSKARISKVKKSNAMQRNSKSQLEDFAEKIQHDKAQCKELQSRRIKPKLWKKPNQKINTKQNYAKQCNAKYFKLFDFTGIQSTVPHNTILNSHFFRNPHVLRLKGGQQVLGRGNI